MSRYNRQEILDKLTSKESLAEVDLQDANLKAANLSCADLPCADLSRARMSGANLYRANLAQANLAQVDLTGANLLGANLFRVSLKGACLKNAKLIVTTEMLIPSHDHAVSKNGIKQARWEVYILGIARQHGFNLEGINLQWADLSGADLREADLRGANLENANLQSADMEGTNLEYANLKNVDLRGANLEGVQLTGANLSGAIFGELTKTKPDSLTGFKNNFVDIAPPEYKNDSNADYEPIISEFTIKPQQAAVKPENTGIRKESPILFQDGIDIPLDNINFEKTGCADRDLEGLQFLAPALEMSPPEERKKDHRSYPITGSLTTEDPFPYTPRKKKTNLKIVKSQKRIKIVTDNSENRPQTKHLYQAPRIRRLGKKQKTITLITPRCFCKGYEGIVHLFIYDALQKDKVKNLISDLSAWRREAKMEKPEQFHLSKLIYGKKVRIEVWPREDFLCRDLIYLIRDEEKVTQLSLAIKVIDTAKTLKQTLVLYVFDTEDNKILCTLKTDVKIKQYFPGRISKVITHGVLSVLSLTVATSLFICSYLDLIQAGRAVFWGIMLLAYTVLSYKNYRSYHKPNLSDNQEIGI
ncbi:MAG: pentapeptide repeat-containing protein [Candidatus Schekmanbacteria bacterium]|nr:pentapeptide repeat-containing protein [Candidatus Schekmanbacteria bacterium]